MKSKVFISIYKFDDEWLDFLSTQYKDSDNTFVALFDLLKNNSKKEVIKILVGYKTYDEVVIVLNDENYYLLEQLLYTLTVFIPKVNIQVITFNKQALSLSFLKRFIAPFRMLGSLIGMRQYKKVVAQYLNSVEYRDKKHDVYLNENSKVFYLKTNLSFGIKAGGSLGHISGVANSLARRSDLTYISAESPIMIDDHISKEKLSLKKLVYSLPYELNSIQINKAFIEQLEVLIQTNRPDIIYQRLTLFNYIGAYLKDTYNIPLIVEYNGSEVWVQKNWGGGLKESSLALAMEEHLLRSADTIITVSQVLQDELIERGFDKEKIVFYPNCIDERVYDYRNFQESDKATLREKLGFEQNDKIFTFIGTFGAWHGVEFLANSIVELVQNHKQKLDSYNVKFLLIGDGLLGEKVRGLLGTQEIKNYVKLTGLIPQKEAPIYLSISDCFLSPHIKQKEKFIGSPTKLFEYMAFAKPIIASNLDQIGEVFTDKLYANELDKFNTIEKESAIVYEPDNYDEFIKSILFVAARGNEIEKIGKNAYEMAMERYTWDVHVDKIINQFNRQ